MSTSNPTPNPLVVQQLAPRGVLRAGINISNFLLVTGKTESGDPVGVAPSMAAEIARLLGVTLQLVPFANPGLLADAAGTDTWDIGLFGADPLRAQATAFSAAYCEIEASYLVPPGSRLTCVADVDQPGVTIAVSARSAYGLWLERNNQHATLLRCDGGSDALNRYLNDKVDALAGLRPGLIGDLAKASGHVILPGGFMAVQQAIGCDKGKPEAEAFLRDFVEDAKASGLVASLIAQHKVQGLSVAPAA
jgi:polar amino acid transport system substrate-binding protein